MLVTSLGAMPAPCAGWRAMIDRSVGWGLGGGEQGRSCTCVSGTVRFWIGVWLLGIKDLSLPPPEHGYLSLTRLSSTTETKTGSHDSRAEGSGIY